MRMHGALPNVVLYSTHNKCGITEKKQQQHNNSHNTHKRQKECTENKARIMNRKCNIQCEQLNNSQQPYKMNVNV